MQTLPPSGIASRAFITRFINTRWRADGSPRTCGRLRSSEVMTSILHSRNSPPINRMVASTNSLMLTGWRAVERWAANVNSPLAMWLARSALRRRTSRSWRRSGFRCPEAKA